MILAAILILVLTVPAAAEDPDSTPFTITIDRFGGFDSIGQAFITGTVLCDPEFGILAADMFVGQKVRGRLEGGWGTVEPTGLICDGTVHEWTGGAVTSRVDDRGNYLFKAGPAFVSLNTLNGEVRAEASVHLRAVGG